MACSSRVQPLAPPLLAYLQRPGLLASVRLHLRGLAGSSCSVVFAYGAGFSELIGSWLVVLGFLTPLGPLALTSTMAIAALQHILTAGHNINVCGAGGPLSGGSLASLLVGPGCFSFDSGLVPALLAAPQNRVAAVNPVPVTDA